MSMRGRVRATLVEAFIRISALSGGRLSRSVRQFLGDERFAALGGTGREGHRDATGALPVSAGRLAPAGSGRTVPLDLVVVTGGSAPSLTYLAKCTSAAQEDGAQVRAVFAVDSPDLAVFRPGGFVVDHLLDRSTLALLCPELDHEVYVEQRSTSLKAVYGARRVLRADLTAAPDDIAPLKDLLEALVAQ